MDSDDITYELTGDNIPDWIFLDEAAQKIVFAPSDESLISEAYAVEFVVKYQ